MKRLLHLGGISVLILVALVSAEVAFAQQPSDNVLVRVFIELPDRARPEDEAAIRSVGGQKRHEFPVSRTISAELPAQVVPILQQVSNRFQSVRLVPEAQALEDVTDWGVRRVNASNVWGGSNTAVNVGATNSSGTGINVAVIDTGISSHSDLSVAGRVQCITPWPEVNGGCSTSGTVVDEQGHGTHVAGTIAALDNGSGLVGVAPKASLYSAKVFGPTGGAYYDDIAAAIDWARLNGMDVVNMSLGGSADDAVLRNAVQAAHTSGVLLIAAAGNSGTCAGTGDQVGYPAKYAEVVAVAATDSNNVSPCWSSVGPDVEISGPGVSICSTWFSNVSDSSACPGMSGQPYRLLQGTSMATPHVVGVAALVMSCNSSLSNSAVRTILQNTATDLDNPLKAGFPDGRDTWYGYGLVQADAAVAATTCTSGGGGASDTTAPTVTNVSSTATNGAYNAGDILPISVTFSEAVTVTGTPQLTLETGGTDAIVNYSSGSGSSTLVFNYTVAADHTSNDLAAVAFLGTVTDGTNPTTNPAMPAPGANGSLNANKALVIDTQLPNNPTNLTSSHTAVASQDNTIQMNWTVATDNGPTAPLGVDGYAYVFSTSSTASCGQPKTLEENVNTVTSQALAANTSPGYYFHICTVDNAGNWSSPVSAGPYPISTPPAPTSTGYRNCTANAAVTSGSGDNNGYQTSPGNACTNNSSYARDAGSGTNTTTSSCSTNTAKDRHSFDNYGFSVPAGATIKGVQVRVDAWVNQTSNFNTRYICVQISKDGGQTWSAVRTTPNLTSSSSSAYTLGSTSDTWDLALDANSFTNGNFRVRITDVGSSTSTSREFRLDWVGVQVTYTP